MRLSAQVWLSATLNNDEILRVIKCGYVRCKCPLYRLYVDENRLLGFQQPQASIDVPAQEEKRANIKWAC